MYSWGEKIVMSRLKGGYTQGELSSWEGKGRVERMRDMSGVMRRRNHKREESE
mgnify:CR=1 FL=1